MASCTDAAVEVTFSETSSEEEDDSAFEQLRSLVKTQKKTCRWAVEQEGENKEGEKGEEGEEVGGG